ncbi:MAG: sulfotransferase [Desulfurivibrionaceae bacterium]
MMFNRAIVRLGRLVNWGLVLIDRAPSDSGMVPEVVYVIGPPRSGSTLVMQTLTDAFDFGYISNGHCRWFGAPALAERWFRPLKNKQPSDYESQHGRTKQDSDPAECGAWWYRFFRRKPAYVTNHDVSERKMRAFRGSLARLQEAFGKPLIFKNLFASLRLEPMAHYVPEALYIVIERDWVDNAQSILKSRKDALGTYDRWWSVPPPNVDELEKLPPVQQVVGQIESIHRLIDEDIQRLGLEDRTFRVCYEEFCADVHGTLERFQAFLASHGVELERRCEVPTEFEVRRSVRIPQKMYDELVEEVACLQVSGRRQGESA